MTLTISLNDMIKEAARAASDKPRTPGNKISPEIAARRLLDHYADLKRNHPLVPGDLVEIKPGLDTSLRYPKAGEPAIVTAFIDPPISDPKTGSGNPFFGVKFNIRVLVFVTDEDNEEVGVVEYAYDSRYFQPYQGKIAE